MKEKAHPWVEAWLPFALYNFLMIHSAVLPPDQFPAFFSKVNDKWKHGIEFAVLFGITVHTLRISLGKQLKRTKQYFFQAFFYCLAMAALTELIQTLTPHRTADIQDFLADLLGASAACGLGWVWFRWKRKSDELL